MGSALSSCARPGRVSTDQRLTVDRVIDWNELRDVVSRDFTWRKGQGVRRMDGKYAILSKEDTKKFLRENSADAYKYIKQDFDCDDFAAVLWGRGKEWWYRHRPDGEHGSWALGFVTGDIRDDGNSQNDDKSRAHALNFVVVPSDDNPEELECWFIEPQSDKWYKPTESSTVSLMVV